VTFAGSAINNDERLRSCAWRNPDSRTAELFSLIRRAWRGGSIGPCRSAASSCRPWIYAHRSWGRWSLWFEQTWESEFTWCRRRDWSWRRSRRCLSRCLFTSALRFHRSRWRCGFWSWCSALSRRGSLGWVGCGMFW